MTDTQRIERLERVMRLLIVEVAQAAPWLATPQVLYDEMMDDGGITDQPLADPSTSCRACGHRRSWHLQDDGECQFHYDVFRIGQRCECKRFVEPPPEWNQFLPPDFVAAQTSPESRRSRAGKI